VKIGSSRKTCYRRFQLIFVQNGQIPQRHLILSIFFKKNHIEFESELFNKKKLIIEKNRFNVRRKLVKTAFCQRKLSHRDAQI